MMTAECGLSKRPLLRISVAFFFLLQLVWYHFYSISKLSIVLVAAFTELDLRLSISSATVQVLLTKLYFLKNCNKYLTLKQKIHEV